MLRTEARPSFDRSARMVSVSVMIRIQYRY
jgi:hypothetical protein